MNAFKDIDVRCMLCISFLSFIILGCTKRQNNVLHNSNKNSIEVASYPPAEKIIAGTPGPESGYREVRISDVRVTDSVYTATLPVTHDRDGLVSIRIRINKQVRTIAKIEFIYKPKQSNVSYRSIGNGIGKYWNNLDRYYFNACFQKKRNLKNGNIEYSSPNDVNGWIEISSSRAAVLIKEI